MRRRIRACAGPHGKLSVSGQLVSQVTVDFHQLETRWNVNQAALRFPRLAEEGVRVEPGVAFGEATGLS